MLTVSVAPVSARQANDSQKLVDRPKATVRAGPSCVTEHGTAG